MRKKQKIFDPRSDWPSLLRMRCNQVREGAGVTQAEFARKLGYRDGSSISQFETGVTERVTVQALNAYLQLAEMNGISRAWCLGVSDAPAAPEETKRISLQLGELPAALAEFLGNFLADKGLAPPPRAAVHGKGVGILGAMDAGAFAGPQPDIVARFRIADAEAVPADWQGHTVPIIGRLAAGAGVDTTEAESYPAGIAAEYLLFKGAPALAVALRIEGDSMEPRFRHGDLVICDMAKPAAGGVCAVIVDSDGDRLARIKRLEIKGRKAVLHSLNAEYPPYTVPAERVEAFEIWKHLRLAD